MTTAIVVVSLLVVIGVGLVFFAGGSRPYKALFADAHLLELFETLERIRAAACDDVLRADEVRPPKQAGEDPATAITSAGLILSYSVREHPEDADVLGHHLSFSHPKGLLAESGCRFLTGFVLVKLGVPPEVATVRRSQNLVVHVGFRLSRAQTPEFARDVRPMPTTEDLRGLRTLAAEVGDECDFADMNVESAA